MGTKILGCSFCSKVTTTLSDQVVDLHCEGSATNQNSLSSSLSRYCLIHEFGDLDMPLAVAQLGKVQEHPQELQWTLSSPVELQWNLNRAPVRMELKFSSGTPGNPLQRSKEYWDECSLFIHYQETNGEYFMAEMNGFYF